MEDGFMLAKEMGQNWSEVIEMASIERNWLLKRLSRYYQERADEIDRAIPKGRGKGLTVED